MTCQCFSVLDLKSGQVPLREEDKCKCNGFRSGATGVLGMWVNAIWTRKCLCYLLKAEEKLDRKPTFLSPLFSCLDEPLTIPSSIPVFRAISCKWRKGRAGI